MHHIGVVAAVAVMRAVGGVRVIRDDEGYQQRQLRGSNAVALFGSLWDELHHSLSNIPASSTRIASFFDLMAATVESGNLHEDIEAFIMTSALRPKRQAREAAIATDRPLTLACWLLSSFCLVARLSSACSFSCRRTRVLLRSTSLMPMWTTTELSCTQVHG